jgi:nucleoside-diphosphate-sugar epimerase
VVGLDSDLYRRCTYPQGGPVAAVPTIEQDTRDIRIEHFSGFDAVIFLAALSNDPLGNLNPSITYEKSHEAPVRTARLAKRAGVRRFLFASSCSNYGARR